MEIFEASDDIRKDLNHFYLKQGYHSNWSQNERAFIATQDDEIIGGVKVENLEGVSILRGMYVANNFQGNQVGTKLIKHIEPILNKTISYCMPFSHLEKFYAQIGFRKTSLKTYPKYLQERYVGYENEGYIIIPMVRDIVD